MAGDALRAESRVGRTERECTLGIGTNIRSGHLLREVAGAAGAHTEDAGGLSGQWESSESSVPEWGVSSGFTRTGAAKDAKRIPRFIPEDDKLCKKEMSCRARMHLGRVGGAKHLRRSRWEHGRVARDGAWPIMMVGHRQAPHESM